jgi:UDP-N-acetyl-D-glucosamine dehydrogenase
MPARPAGARRLAPMRVAVVGLGYVGLPLARAFAAAGDDVAGIDIDPRRAQAARAAGVPAGTEASAVAGADAVVLCLPTPLTANREPDLGAVTSAARAVAPHLRAGTLVVLESTSYPGTTRERLVPLLEEGSGLRAGGDLHVAYSPERLDPGRDEGELATTPKLVAGLTRACLERALVLYEHVFERLVPVSTPEAAEFTKLLENIFRAVNIALVNELAVLADRMGVDIWEVVDAAATKPYGFMPFRPGPGMGGHCLPVDPFYLAWRAREFGVPTEFIELAGKVNQRMPDHCAARVQRALNDRGLAVRGARVLLLGLSYKPGIGDVRESPALRIAEHLRALGGDVGYHDPHVPDPPGPGLRPLGLDDGLAWADVAVIVTAHPEVDHADVARRARLTVDLRGVTRDAGVASVVRL